MLSISSNEPEEICPIFEQGEDTPKVQGISMKITPSYQRIRESNCGGIKFPFIKI